MDVYGAAVVEQRLPKGSARYDFEWTFRYREPTLLTPPIITKLEKQIVPLPADPSMDLPSKDAEELGLFGALLVPVFVGIIAGFIVGAVADNATPGVIAGLVLCVVFWVLVVPGEVAKLLPENKAARAEVKSRTLTEAESGVVRDSVVEVPIPDPRGRWSTFEPVRKSTKKRPLRRDDPLDLLKRLAAETHQLSTAIRSSVSWGSPLLSAHRAQFKPKTEEQQILDHIAALYRAFAKLGDEPQGSTAAALTASAAHTAATLPLNAVLDTIIARVTALHRYRSDLEALDTELAHAESAKRSLELDGDTAKLFASAVGNEFATRHLDALGEQARTMGASVNELVESLNGDLQTLVALAPDRASHI